jgi:fructose-bisphosphate aldolase class 1
MNDDVGTAALAPVARGKGILAADETVREITRRFDALGIPATEQRRCTTEKRCLLLRRSHGTYTDEMEAMPR